MYILITLLFVVDNQAQFFYGIHSLTCDVFGMKTDKQFVSTLEDVIRYRGAIYKIVSDSAHVEITGCVKDIIRAYVIGNWLVKPSTNSKTQLSTSINMSEQQTTI